MILSAFHVWMNPLHDGRHGAPLAADSGVIAPRFRDRLTWTGRAWSGVELAVGQPSLAATCADVFLERFPRGVRGVSRGYFVPLGLLWFSWPWAGQAERKRGPGLIQGGFCTPASLPACLPARAQSVGVFPWRRRCPGCGGWVTPSGRLWVEVCFRPMDLRGRAGRGRTATTTIRIPFPQGWQWLRPWDAAEIDAEGAFSEHVALPQPACRFSPETIPRLPAVSEVGKPGTSSLYLARQPLRSQETPAAIRADFAVQHLVGT